MSKQVYKVLFLSVCAIVLSGCGSNTPQGPRLYTIAGTAAFMGEPLKDADLLVRSADGKRSAGTKVTDGKFTLRAPAGQMTVEITALRDVPGEFREENPGERVPVRVQFLPPKYNTESTLTLDVKPDTKEVKFDLAP